MDICNKRPNILSALRALHPRRAVTLFEALRVAELQANRLLELNGVVDAPTPSHIVADSPRVAVDFDVDMGSYSGASNWNKQHKTWVITLNALESHARQRFSLMHEFKHIIDHGGAGLTDAETPYRGRNPVEFVADFFAACVLMPKRLVKRAWGQGIQNVTDLATHFDVSRPAIRVRLNHLGLGDDTGERCRLSYTPAWQGKSTAYPGLHHRTPSNGRPLAAGITA